MSTRDSKTQLKKRLKDFFGGRSAASPALSRTQSTAAIQPSKLEYVAHRTKAPPDIAADPPTQHSNSLVADALATRASTGGGANYGQESTKTSPLEKGFKPPEEHGAEDPASATTANAQTTRDSTDKRDRNAQEPATASLHEKSSNSPNEHGPKEPTFDTSHKLWNAAYDDLEKDEAELVGSYIKVLERVLCSETSKGPATAELKDLSQRQIHMQKLMKEVKAKVVLLLILSFVPYTIALSRWNVSSSEFVRICWISSIVANNSLYIDGGEYYLHGASSYNDLIFLPTLSIELSSSWEISSIIINALNKPPGLNYFKNEALWWTPEISSFEAFGGQPYTAITNTIWSLAPDGNGGGTWSEEYFPGGTFWQSVTWPSHGSIAASSTNLYYLGGYAQYGNRLGAITGMIELGVDYGGATNITTAGRYSSSGMSIDGAAQFVASFGEAGLLILLGGNTPILSFDANSVLRPMSNITIYDPSSMLWYSQTATGDIPAPRSNMCIVGAQSTNSSTFEIFVYGGWTGYFSAIDNTDSQNVYILTLPAFRWIRVSASTAPRAGSSCQVVNSQMISVGGWDPTGTASYTNIDPWTYGVGVFDLTSLNWRNGFNSSARPYVRSDLVNAFYADNALHPTSWDNPALGAIFGNNSATTSSVAPIGATTTSAPTTTSQSPNPPTTSPPPTTVGSTATPSPSASNTQDSSSLSTAAQVGLAVGCAFGAALLTIIATWWKPHQIGRFICCGMWPRRHESVTEARKEMRRLIATPFSP